MTNSIGSVTSTKSGYIRITDTTYSLPFSENFEDSIFPPANWRLENPDSGGIDSRTWYNDLLFGAFGQSQQCAAIRMSQYRIYDQLDGLILPPLDLTNMQSAQMSFSVAYEPYDSLFWLDTLIVSVSSDCGASWQEVYRKGGHDLSVLNTTSSFFLPDSSDWKLDSADLSIAAQSVALVKIETLNKFGNNLYLDDVSIEGVPVSINERTLNKALRVYPNPSSGEIYVDLQSSKSQSIYIWVSDMLGRKLNTESRLIRAGINKLYFNFDKLKGTGVCFLNIVTNDHIYTSKLIIY